jgi:alpha-L-fucosidase
MLLLALVCGLFAATAQNNDWQSDKYSMFIHFGLYSHFGGVYDGEPVRQGYSE